LVAELKGHKNWVYSAIFSPDDSQIISRCYDGKVFVWDATTTLPISEYMVEDIKVEQPSRSPFRCDQTGWLLYSRLEDVLPVRMCWIPFIRRPHTFLSSFGGKVVMGSKTGIITILDCSSHPGFRNHSIAGIREW
jgi:WD40 repeat protein